MKETPLLMSAPMVRQTLAGSKTQTRRVVTGVPAGDVYPLCSSAGKPVYPIGFPGVYFVHNSTCGPAQFIRGRYGQRGDRLWVRETFSVAPSPDATYGEAMRASRMTVTYAAGGSMELRSHSVSGPGYHVDTGNAASEYPMVKWGINRPSIFMPRWACRLVLDVTAVRVERLQAITDADIEREGVTREIASDLCRVPLAQIPTLREAWALVWDAINGERAPWTTDPWVWVIEFKRVPTEVNP